MSKPGALALATAAILAMAVPSAKAATFLAASSSSLCGAAGCFSDSTTWRKTYSADSFSGHVDIGALMLDRGVLGDNQDLVFKVSFRTTDGAEVGDWGSFMIAGLGGEVVQIGGKAFTWDTSQGDLVLTLDLVVPTKGGAGGGFGGGGGGGFGGGRFEDLDDGGGLAAFAHDEVDFARNPVDLGHDLAILLPAREPLINLVVAVPEPASWALMVTGFGAAGALLRRQRRHLRYS